MIIIITDHFRGCVMQMVGCVFVSVCAWTNTFNRITSSISAMVVYFDPIYIKFISKGDRSKGFMVRSGKNLQETKYFWLCKHITRQGKSRPEFENVNNSQWRTLFCVCRALCAKVVRCNLPSSYYANLCRDLFLPA